LKITHQYLLVASFKFNIILFSRLKSYNSRSIAALFMAGGSKNNNKKP